MPRGTLDDKYLTWMYGQVADGKHRRSSKTYWNLFRQMHATEFKYFVPHDGNRAEDGKDLRAEWAGSANVDPDQDWLELGCSFLEMLVALSRRMWFQAEQTPEFWFWKLLENLDLLQFEDTHEWSPEEAQEIIDCVINRTYHRSGAGGLFPLRKTRKDQTRVELWYQMSEYLLQDM